MNWSGDCNPVLTGGSSDRWTISSPMPTSTVIYANSKPLVTIRPDGSIEYGPDYNPDAAAKIFWDAIGFERKQRLPEAS